VVSLPSPLRRVARAEVDHYDIVPQLVAERILANAKRPIDEEEE
jgi:elongation factor G